jgi:anti-anti-sigma regulatory factor
MVRQRSIARQQGEQQEPRYEVKIVVKDGSERWVDLSARRIDMQGQPAIMATALDITARKEMEEDRARLHEETIQAQQSMLRELSTPLIPITDHVVVMPLVGRIDTWRAQQVLEGLLQGVAQHNASTAILDITGVPVVDTQVALALIQAAQAVRLLGAQVVLTGIRPDVAQSLVSLGVDLSDIVTLSSLQAGIAYATQQHRA